MSDGIVRVCDLHKMELRQIGVGFVCPSGHQCDVAWHIPASGLPWADPRARLCPIHGKRLTGAGDILDCEQYGHQCSTRDADRPAPARAVAVAAAKPLAPVRVEAQPLKPEIHTEEPMPVRKTDKPHGTPGRYWQGCKCRPCRTAISDYQKARKAGPPSGRAKLLSVKRAVLTNALAKIDPSPATSPQRVNAVLVPAQTASLGRAAGAILELREKLSAAEAAFAAQVSAFLPGYALARAERSPR